MKKEQCYDVWRHSFSKGSRVRPLNPNLPTYASSDSMSSNSTHKEQERWSRARLQILREEKADIQYMYIYDTEGSIITKKEWHEMRIMYSAGIPLCSNAQFKRR